MRMSLVNSLVFLSVVLLCASAFLNAHTDDHGFLRFATQAAQKQQASQTKTVTLLDTTDSHSHILPWDYYENRAGQDRNTCEAGPSRRARRIAARLW